MIDEIETTIKLINSRITDRHLLPDEIMKLTQSALNLAHVAATIDGIKNKT